MAAAHASDTTYHRYAGIESISALQPAEVYPNPFSESVTIQLTGNITNMQMELVDLFGRKLMEGKITTNTTTISTATLAQGVYLLRLYSNGQWVSG